MDIVNNNADLTGYVGKFIEIVLDDKFFYHGTFLGFNDLDMEVDDVKVGPMIISRNRRYAMHEMTVEEKLRLAGKMSSSHAGVMTNLEKLDARILDWQTKNREDAHKLVEAAGVLLGLTKGKKKGE
jgi:hypothetical protein